MGCEKILFYTVNSNFKLFKRYKFYCSKGHIKGCKGCVPLKFKCEEKRTQQDSLTNSHCCFTRKPDII